MSVESEEGNGETNPITMTMGAEGMDGILLNGGSDGLSLSATADALLLDMHIEETGLFGLSDDTVSSLRVGRSHQTFPPGPWRFPHPLHGDGHQAGRG